MTRAAVCLAAALLFGASGLPLEPAAPERTKAVPLLVGPGRADARPEVLPTTALRLLRAPAVVTVDRARDEVLRGVKYSRAYARLDAVRLADIDRDRSACTDLVVRALRAGGLDLQALVFDDVSRDASEYGLVRADPSIDHRRAATLLEWFGRHYAPLSLDADDSDFRPGDVVFYGWGCLRAGRPCRADHIALVSDRRGRSGRWMVLQNGGPRASEDDHLAKRTMVGHFRPLPR